MKLCLNRWNGHCKRLFWQGRGQVKRSGQVFLFVPASLTEGTCCTMMGLSSTATRAIRKQNKNLTPLWAEIEQRKANIQAQQNQDMQSKTLYTSSLNAVDGLLQLNNIIFSQSWQSLSKSGRPVISTRANAPRQQDRCVVSLVLLRPPEASRGFLMKTGRIV